MRVGKPLFVDKNNNAISINWVSRLVPRLAVKAGIQNNLDGNRIIKKSEKVGHELRDLLKSTLIVSGCMHYVCELAIGHTVGDSYEKQDKLYHDKSRSEYAKASSKINIFSNVSTYIQKGDQSDELKIKLRDAEIKIQDIKKDFDSKLDYKIKESFGKFASEFEAMMDEKNKQFIDSMTASDEMAIKKMQMIGVIKKANKIEQ